jgi:hypothetical protein
MIVLLELGTVPTGKINQIMSVWLSINIGIKSETRLLHLCKIVFVTFMVCINNWVILTSSNNYKHILHYRRNVESQTDIIWLIFPVGTVPNSNRTIIERGKFYLIIFGACYHINNISATSWWSALLVEEHDYPEKTTDLPQVTDKH